MTRLETVNRFQSRLRAAPLVLLAWLPRAAVAADPAPEAQAAVRFEHTWRTHAAPGMSTAVALKGKIVFSEGHGFAELDNMVPATGTTVYNIGSVSKANTAVAVMQLLEQGKIGLDDPIQKYVASFPDKGAPITIKHVMTHTSGIRHYRPTDFPDSQDNENMKPVTSLEEGIRIFKDDPLLFEPGGFYFYSSYAVNLLQGVVEKAGGMPFEDYMRRYVWGPAGMLSTAFDVPERIVPHRAKGYLVDKGRIVNNPYGDLTQKFAGGGMISTAEDLVRLGVALNHGTLLRAETVALMYKAQLDPVVQFQEKGPPRKESFQQGLIWRTLKDASGRAFVYHCGSVKGFGACLVNYPDQDLVVATMANASDSPGWPEAVAIAQYFLDSKAAPPH